MPLPVEEADDGDEPLEERLQNQVRPGLPIVAATQPVFPRALDHDPGSLWRIICARLIRTLIKAALRF